MEYIAIIIILAVFLFIIKITLSLIGFIYEKIFGNKKIRKKRTRDMDTVAYREQMLERLPLNSSLSAIAALKLRKYALQAIDRDYDVKSIAARLARNDKVQLPEDQLCYFVSDEINKIKFIENAARAKWIGSKGYVWRTANDADVCPICAKNEGKMFSWDRPPRFGHPGFGHKEKGCSCGICRCWAEAILPDY